MMNSPIGPTTITSKYGERWGRMHHGVDLRAPLPTPIKSPMEGIVLDAETRETDCGGTIFIKHDNNIKTRYCHCSKIFVKKGDRVEEEDVIGLTGGGDKDVGKGNSQGPHLHFEVYLNEKTVNPIDYVNFSDYVDTLDVSQEHDKENGNSEDEDFDINKFMKNSIFGLISSMNIDTKEIKDNLKNLGYDITNNSNLTDIIKKFQEDKGLDVTGKLDKKTTDLLINKN